MTSVRLDPQLDSYTATPCCQSCRSPLSLHQPDAEQPERLLGTCEACKAWYLIDAADKAMLPLPDPGPSKAPSARRSRHA